MVRFNRYTKDVAAVGKKVDLHIIHTNQQWQRFCNPEVVTVPMECDKFESNYVSPRPVNVHPMNKSIWENTCSFSDSSRGFLSFLFLRRLFDRVDLIGFGGVGHHDKNSEWKALHNMDVEYEMILGGDLNS